MVEQARAAPAPPARSERWTMTRRPRRERPASSTRPGAPWRCTRRRRGSGSAPGGASGRGARFGHRRMLANHVVGHEPSTFGQHDRTGPGDEHPGGFQPLDLPGSSTPARARRAAAAGRAAGRASPARRRARQPTAARPPPAARRRPRAPPDTAAATAGCGAARGRAWRRRRCRRPGSRRPASSPGCAATRGPGGRSWRSRTTGTRARAPGHHRLVEGLHPLRLPLELIPMGVGEPRAGLCLELVVADVVGLSEQASSRSASRSSVDWPGTPNIKSRLRFEMPAALSRSAAWRI